MKFAKKGNKNYADFQIDSRVFTSPENLRALKFKHTNTQKWCAQVVLLCESMLQDHKKAVFIKCMITKCQPITMPLLKIMEIVEFYKTSKTKLASQHCMAYSLLRGYPCCRGKVYNISCELLSLVWFDVAF